MKQLDRTTGCDVRGRTARRVLAGRALGAATLAVLAGCASFTPVAGAPITSIALIAGKWAGTMSPGSQGFREPFYLTIGTDGTLMAAWGSNTAWGRVAIQNGHAAYEMHPSVYEGTLRLYDDGGKRTLVLDDLWSPFRAEVTPQG
jgi:hypothetical protein